MKKFKLFSSYTEEENWLNQQSESGWRLVKKGIFYTFNKGADQPLVYAIDYRTFKNKGDYQDYLSLFQDSGWTHMGGSRWSGEHYFSALPNQEKDISIFSDRESSINRYKKKIINCLYGILFLSCYLALSLLFGSFDGYGRMILKPKLAFLTPGLWERSGIEFWKAFLFELPFALIFRILPIILIIGYAILIMIYLFWAIYGEKQERMFEDEK